MSVVDNTGVESSAIATEKGRADNSKLKTRFLKIEFIFLGGKISSAEKLCTNYWMEYSENTAKKKLI